MNLPGRTSYEGTAILGGLIKPREAIIIGAGLLGGFSTIGILIGMKKSVFLAIVLGAAIFIFSIIYALWRIDKVYTVEQHILRKLGFGSRTRKFRLGGGGHAGAHQFVRADEYSATAAYDGEIEHTALPLSNPNLVYAAGSLFLFIVCLAWIGTSGIIELQNLLRSI
jgi:hypothetical protein